MKLFSIKKLLPVVFCLLLTIINCFYLKAQTNGNFEKQIISIAPIDTVRVKEIAKMLPELPKGFGHPIENREIWNKLASLSSYKAIIQKAEKSFKSPIPAWSDTAYLEFSITGSRPNGEKMMKVRIEWLKDLFWAECLENKGRFLSSIETAINDIINQKSWVLPAHDKRNTNFYGSQYTLDLYSSLIAASLAECSYVLHSKISDATKNNIITAITKRVFKPILQSIDTKDNNHWFLTSTNNWTAVCLAGLSISALSILPNKNDRAIYVSITERYIKNFINGFYDDGYCEEGLGYYYYGYGNYILAREIIYQNTNGKIDLLDSEKCKKIALYTSNLEITDGVFPTIGDCKNNVAADAAIEWYNNNQFKLGKPLTDFVATPTDLLYGMMFNFLNRATDNKRLENHNKQPIRSFFDKAGVLICRPNDTVSKNNFGVCLVAGSNNESHNHNDVGSFTIVVSGEKLMGDPGGPYEYNNKTFTDERYTLFKSFASFGHPVPLVAHQQQVAGKGTQAIILKTDFTPEKDIYIVDLKPAYNLPELQNLTRSFTFDRTGKGSLTVMDEFELSKHSAFEVAFTTRTQWKQINATQIKFTGEKSSMVATITAPCKFKIVSEDIHENQPVFHRLGIVLEENLKRGAVKVVFTP